MSEQLFGIESIAKQNCGTSLRMFAYLLSVHLSIRSLKISIGNACGHELYLLSTCHIIVHISAACVIMPPARFLGLQLNLNYVYEHVNDWLSHNRESFSCLKKCARFLHERKVI